MGKSIYDYLKLYKDCDDIIYCEILKENKVLYTYKDLYNRVNEYVELFDKNNLRGKTGYLLVVNSVETIAMFIALLEVKANVILEDKEYNVKNNPKDFLLYDYSLYDDMYSHFFDLDLKYKLEKSNDEINSGKIGLKTSGTLGDANILFIDEEKLIKVFNNNKTNSSNERILNITNLSSISSIILNILEPIINHSTSYLLNYKLHGLDRAYSKEISKKYLSLLIENDISYTFFTRHIIESIPKRISDYRFDCLNKVLLSGELINKNVIDLINDKFNGLKSDALTIAYGSTEALGIISSCNEIDNNIVYVNTKELINNRFLYTTDLKHIYEKCGNKFKLSYMKYDANSFVPFLPCSSDMDKFLIDKEEFNGNFSNEIGEVYYKDCDDNYITSNDIGFSYNDRLYLVDRKKNITKVNNKMIPLSLIEKQIKLFINNTVVTVEKNGSFYVFIGIEHNSFGDSVEDIENKIAEINTCLRSNFENCNIKIYIVKESLIPLSSSSGKISRKDVFWWINKVVNSYGDKNEIIKGSELEDKSYSFDFLSNEITNYFGSHKIINNIIIFENLDNPYKVANKFVCLKYVSNVKVNEKKKCVYVKINKDCLVDKEHAFDFFEINTYGEEYSKDGFERLRLKRREVHTLKKESIKQLIKRKK